MRDVIEKDRKLFRKLLPIFVTCNNHMNLIFVTK